MNRKSLILIATTVVVGVVAVVLALTRGGSEVQPSPDPTVSASSGAATPTPSATPTDPYIKYGPDGEPMDNLDMGPIIAETQPVAESFVKGYFTYTYRSHDIVSQIRPFTDAAYLDSLSADLTDPAIWDEVEKQKSSSTMKVTKVEYSDRFDEGQLTIEFHVKLRTYTDFDDANPNSPNDLAYIVGVARTKAGWKVVSFDLPGAS